MDLQELHKQAAELSGRHVEVEKTADGKYIVLWMSFQRAPPPKADTPEGALTLFISMMLKLKAAGDTIFDTEPENEDTEGNTQDGTQPRDT
jgi:hypothetical protein